MLEEKHLKVGQVLRKRRCGLYLVSPGNKLGELVLIPIMADLSRVTIKFTPKLTQELTSY